MDNDNLRKMFHLLCNGNELKIESLLTLYDEYYHAGYEEGIDAGYKKLMEEERYDENNEAGQDAAYDEGLEEGREEGFNNGYESGLDQGYQNGLEESQDGIFNNGKVEGYEEGREDGYNNGYEDGQREAGEISL
jgi:flagellar biosynthesis/type III secretory pathway protein FliH